MAASLTKTQSYAASQWESQTSGNALTVTLVADDYLWIRQTLTTTDDSVTPTLTEMALAATEATVDCTLEAIIVQGYDPTVWAPVYINASPEAISIQSLEPYILIGTPTEINCTLEALSLSGNNPQALQGTAVFVTVEALIATGLASGVISTTAINCSLEAITITSYETYIENLHDVPCRLYSVPADDRTIELEAESRLYEVPAEDRLYTIICA